MHYVDEHMRDQYRFIVFDKCPAHPGHVVIQSLAEKSYSGDFTDTALIESIFKENKIDLVIHSLSTTVPVDSANARYDVETNLLPTLDVLALMVKYNVKDIVYISSGGAVYGTRDQKPHLESDAVYPISSYGTVKVATEKYMMQYGQLYGLRPLIVRLSNPYGAYHYSMKQGVINIAMTKALRGETLQIWGDGNDKKDYIYVEDFVDILFKLFDKDIANQVINIGSGTLLSVNEIAKAVRVLVPNFKAEHADAKQFDASHFELNTDKLKSIIGEYAFTSFSDGLQKTYYWTKTICD
jgi:UDP-glucose 4-epimerase